MTAADDQSPIARLRRVVRAFEGGELPGEEERAWFCSAVRQYEIEARAGATLDRALGLVPAPGQESWWTAEARETRNETIRQIRREYFPDLGITAASREIAQAARRYQATSWRFEKGASAGPPADKPHRLIAQALETGCPFPDQRQIRKVLGTEL
jgi:hypothetical protein